MLNKLLFDKRKIRRNSNVGKLVIKNKRKDKQVTI